MPSEFAAHASGQANRKGRSMGPLRLVSTGWVKCTAWVGTNKKECVDGSRGGIGWKMVVGLTREVVGDKLRG